MSVTSKERFLEAEAGLRFGTQNAPVHEGSSEASCPICVQTDADRLNPTGKPTRVRLLREAALLVCCEQMRTDHFLRHRLSLRDWKRLIDWMDVSGLTLYFYDQVVVLQPGACLPYTVRLRMENNRRHNQQRTRGMIAESVAIQRSFQDSNLSYATLKGFSLPASSVPRPELRLQFDLDFLVDEQSVSAARNILEQRGYRLYAMSGRTWEFKSHVTPGVSLADMYKDLPGRSVELHIEQRTDRAHLLQRLEIRDFHGIQMPVLASVDLFLDQGLHAYKHVCSEFFRNVHLLEFRRHVMARRGDTLFWRQVEFAAAQRPGSSVALGIVIQLITHVIGEFAPDVLTRWTSRSLPVTAMKWITMYGRQSVFQGFPGSKLYLLLQLELGSHGASEHRSLPRALFPRRLPPAILQPTPGAKWSTRIRSHFLQLRFVIVRFRFHLAEGLRFAWQSYRWRNRREEDSQ